MPAHLRTQGPGENFGILARLLGEILWVIQIRSARKRLSSSVARRLLYRPAFSDLSFQLRPETCEGGDLDGVTTDRGEWINSNEFSDFMRS